MPPQVHGNGLLISPVVYAKTVMDITIRVITISTLMIINMAFNIYCLFSRH
jgi:hypothetical protein